jgi:hypothetical protein
MELANNGKPTTVKGVMTPKGAQLNNHAHIHPRHTCPAVYGHHIYNTIVYTRLMCNAVYTTADEISTSNHALLVVSCS